MFRRFTVTVAFDERQLNQDVAGHPAISQQQNVCVCVCVKYSRIEDYKINVGLISPGN